MEPDWQYHLLLPWYSVFIMPSKQEVNGVTATGHSWDMLTGCEAPSHGVNNLLGEAAERRRELAVTVTERNADLCVYTETCPVLVQSPRQLTYCLQADVSFR